MTDWVRASDQLPPAGQYVLVYVDRNNWLDNSDPLGVYCSVAKLVHGLSLIDRERMRSGELPDPVYCGSLRSNVWSFGDETGSNLRPFQWATFGPGSFYAQEISHWARITPPTEAKEPPRFQSGP